MRIGITILGRLLGCYKRICTCCAGIDRGVTDNVALVSWLNTVTRRGLIGAAEFPSLVRIIFCAGR